jgi:filamentous hemagglutinin
LADWQFDELSLTVNPISATHAETDVLQQLADLGGAGGARATLYVDYPAGLCGACGRSGADQKVASLNEAAQAGDLRVTPFERSGTSAADRYRSAGGAVASGEDVDHVIDLQLGGADDVSEYAASRIQR